jgi:predicted CoA-substrate-specific enzyme activase
MICAGIDAGSRTIKAVLIDSEDLHIIGSGIVDQGVKQAELAEELLEKVCSDSGVKRNDIIVTIATGYGRATIGWATKAITEITCQARGIHQVKPGAKTVIDIGGQDSKLLRLDDLGNVRDFAMNDRCAAGTGRFLEVVARLFDMGVTQMGEISLKADSPCSISSMCVVFAETEIIGLLATGESIENITAGVQRSIASRIRSMAGRKVAEPIVFTGGVVLIPGMNAVMSDIMGHPTIIAPIPQITAAYGAAILGCPSN